MAVAWSGDEALEWPVQGCRLRCLGFVVLAGVGVLDRDRADRVIAWAADHATELDAQGPITVVPVGRAARAAAREIVQAAQEAGWPPIRMLDCSGLDIDVARIKPVET